MTTAVLAEPKSKTLPYASATFVAYAAVCWLLTKYGLIIPQFPAAILLLTFFFLFASFGLVTVVVESAIFTPFRDLSERIPVIGPVLYERDGDGNEIGGIFSCAMCAGMGVGILLAATGLALIPVPHNLIGSLILFLHGLLGVGINWLLHLVTLRLSQPFEVSAGVRHEYVMPGVVTQPPTGTP